MRKQLLVSASAIALAFGFSMPASADDSATASSTGTVSNNTSSDPGSTRSNLDMQMNSGSGMAHEQQNAGDNNILNISTAALGQTVQGDLTADATADASTNGNGVSATGDGSLATFGSDDPDRENTLTDSFGAFTGQASVQQNNGDANSMQASTAVVGDSSAGTDSISQDAYARASTSSNTGLTEPAEPGAEPMTEGPVIDDGQARLNTLGASFDGADGVKTVQQNNGTANGLAASTSIRATLVRPSQSTARRRGLRGCRRAFCRS